jgi:hypothetical protein
MDTFNTRPEGKVFNDAHFWVEWATFGHIANAPADSNGIPKNINTIDGNLTRSSGKKSSKDTHGGRFACAIGAKESDNLTFQNIERNTAHCEEIAVVLGEIFNMNHKASPSSQQKAGYQVANFFKINRS